MEQRGQLARKVHPKFLSLLGSNSALSNINVTWKHKGLKAKFCCRMHCIILEQTSNFFHEGSARTRRGCYSSLARFVRVGGRYWKGDMGLERMESDGRKGRGEGKEKRCNICVVMLGPPLQSSMVLCDKSQTTARSCMLFVHPVRSNTARHQAEYCLFAPRSLHQTSYGVIFLWMESIWMTFIISSTLYCIHH